MQEINAKHDSSRPGVIIKKSDKSDNTRRTESEGVQSITDLRGPITRPRPDELGIFFQPRERRISGLSSRPTAQSADVNLIRMLRRASASPTRPRRPPRGGGRLSRSKCIAKLLPPHKQRLRLIANRYAARVLAISGASPPIRVPPFIAHSK